MFRTQVVETSGVHGIRTQGCRMDGADKSSLNYDQNAFKCQDPDMNQTFKYAKTTFLTMTATLCPVTAVFRFF